MKIFYQFLIIVFVVVSLFLIRGDLLTVYNKVHTYISNKVPPSIANNNVSIQSNKILNITKSVITPGALNTSSNNSSYDLASNANNAKLTVSGVINITNSERLQNGNLPPLKENTKLDLSAQTKLADMFKQQYFEHISPDGVGVADLANKEGYDYIIIGENLALGNFKEDQALLDAWMASPGHRANILNSHYMDIGVAVGHGMYDGKDTWLAVQHFGLPSSACPTVDNNLKGKISIEENNISSMKNDLDIRKNQIDSGAIYNGMTTNEQISQYNQLVSNYNQMIIDVKQKVTTFNTQVDSYNSCLKSNS